MTSSTGSALALSLLFSGACLAASPVQHERGRSLAAACFTCHGTNGNSVGNVPPSLAGRDRAELLETMRQFQSGKRPATIMHQQSKGYTDAQLEDIAAYFARLEPAPASAAPAGTR